MKRIAKKKITFATIKKHGVVLLKKSWVVSSFQLLLRLRFKCTLIFMPRKVSYLLLIISTSYFILITLGLVIDGSWSRIFPIDVFFVLTALLLIIVSFRIRDFYYDDRYEIFMVRNPRILLPFFEKTNKYTFELPKGQVKGYKLINRLFYKKLTLYFSSYHGDYKVKHFHLYFVSGNTINAIISNLEQLVGRNNRE